MVKYFKYPTYIHIHLLPYFKFQKKYNHNSHLHLNTIFLIHAAFIKVWQEARFILSIFQKFVILIFAQPLLL